MMDFGQPIRQVVVLGGGSAGFMAALALKVKLPDLGVTIVRSRDIGIIGVGEGSTIGLTSFLHDYLRVNLKKFYAVARPTWKLGLKFLWGPPARPEFYYSFKPTLHLRQDAALRKPDGYYCAGKEDLAYADKFCAMMAHGRAFERGPQGIQFHDALAYHFENERFVTFLEQYADALGVRVVEDKVVRVGQDEAGLTGLELESGRVERADLYVDCSGFRSELLGRALGEPFVDYGSSLFCDRAVVGGWPRGADESVIKPYTTCETMDSGWAWQIEHEERINRGYVYASGFVTDDDAEREFRAKNPKLGATRVLRFVSGRYARRWVKNVVAIGNASGFVEPLEATALGVIGVQSMQLAETLLGSDRRPRPTQVAQTNDFHARAWDAIRRFIAVHYRFNTLLDTPFWRACRADVNLAGGEAVVDYFRENGPGAYWDETLIDRCDQFGMPGYVVMLVGQQVPYARSHAPTDHEIVAWNARRTRHRQAAERALTVRQALDLVHSAKWRWT